MRDAFAVFVWNTRYRWRQWRAYHQDRRALTPRPIVELMAEAWE